MLGVDLISSDPQFNDLMKTNQQHFIDPPFRLRCSTVRHGYGLYSLLIGGVRIPQNSVRSVSCMLGFIRKVSLSLETHYDNSTPRG